MDGALVPIVPPVHGTIEVLERVWARGDVALLRSSDDRRPADSGPTASARSLPPDAAVVLASSGTTGHPRDVVLTHTALATSAAGVNARLGCAVGERWALALPPERVAGLMVVLRGRALSSATVTVTDRGDPEALLRAGEGGDVHLALVPTQLARLITTGQDLARFRTLLVGGGPTPPGLLDAARAAGGRVVTSYGMTETCGGCVHDGVPLDGVEVDVLQDGRIRLRGPVLAAGYLERAPAAGGPGEDEPDGGGFRPDGWFITNDRGRIADGRLIVEGRWDDVIVTGGAKVPAGAVERVLLAHPGVSDAVVIGVPDAEWGQRVRAVITARDRSAPPDLAALRDHVRSLLPASHAPTQLVLVPELPRDAMGKLRASERQALAERAPDTEHGAGGTTGTMDRTRAADRGSPVRSTGGTPTTRHERRSREHPPR